MGMIFLSENACSPLVQSLSAAGHDIYMLKPADAAYPAIAAHADIFMCLVGDTLLIDDAILTEPELPGRRVTADSSPDGEYEEDYFLVPPVTAPDGRHRIVFNMGNIGHSYPYDVPYNAVVTDSFLMHNTELTAPAILDRAREAGLQIINVKQGYTRCSCLPVGSRAFITADEGIARSLRAWNELVRSEAAAAADAGDSDEAAAILADIADILLIRPGYIHLEGFEHGFIGGTAGAVGRKIYFNGDLTEHPDSDLIIRFIYAHGFEPVWFADEPLTDIGSIFYI